MTLEMCCECDEPTGRAGAGDDSIYTDGGIGPFCEECRDTGAGVDQREARITALEAERAALRAEVERLQGTSTMIDDVRAFHEAMDVPILPKPGWPAADRIQLRSRLINEEFQELRRGIARSDFIQTADGIVDLIYVLIGTALEFGIPLAAVWDEVHRTNMAKVGGPIREDGKRLKPEGWEPPDLARAMGLIR